MKHRLWFFLHGLEKILWVLIIVVFICFFLTQIMLATEKGRNYLSVTDQLEGKMIYPLNIK